MRTNEHAAVRDAAVKRRLRPHEVEAIYGIPCSTFAKKRLTGDCWIFEKVGKSILSDPVEIEKYLAARRRRSTSDTGDQAA